MIFHCSLTKALRSPATLSLLLILPTLLWAGCDDDPSPAPVAGETAAGETAAGETAAGETAAGETAAGETAAGETVAGETVAGETVAGETVAGETAAGETAAGETAGTEMITGLPLNDLIPEVAAAMCQGLFGCCDMTDHESFLLSFQNTPRYEEVVDQLPPTVAFDENSCPSMIETILTAAPFGRWIEQVNEQRVSYDGDAAQSCLDTLNNAQCGDEFIAALYDGTCLSPFPPFGGEDQRKMFSRTATAGESCVALTDGQGGVIFGTCDPNTAFCCVRRDDNTCKIPEQNEVGECVAASDLGEPCSILPSAQVCATGKECGFESGVCEPATEYIDVQLGEECAEDYSFFGICQDSYCDVTGTGTCLPRKADGEACVFPDECEGGACTDQVCAVDSYCR